MDPILPTARTLEEFRRRRRLLEHLRNEDAQARLAGFIDWIDGEPSVKQIVDSVEKAVAAVDLLAASNRFQPPNTRTPEDVAGVGLFLMRQVIAGEELWRLADTYGILPPFPTVNVHDMISELLNRFINPAIEYLDYELASRVQESMAQEEQAAAQAGLASRREPVKLTTPGSTYVHPQRIEELKSLPSEDFDLTKLLQLLHEINVCHEHGCYFAIAALVRTVLDHVPPIFGFTAFCEVTNNYKGARSFKESMNHLDNEARKIADQHLHGQVRRREVLPTIVQVDFSNSVDVLLSEIVRILRH